MTYCRVIGMVVAFLGRRHGGRKRRRHGGEEKMTRAQNFALSHFQLSKVIASDGSKRRRGIGKAQCSSFGDGHVPLFRDAFTRAPSYRSPIADHVVIVMLMKDQKMMHYIRSSLHRPCYNNHSLISEAQ